MRVVLREVVEENLWIACGVARFVIQLNVLRFGWAGRNALHER